ncbi:MAG: hypothetical protein ACRDBQ_18645 [Shewanella sp.]
MANFVARKAVRESTGQVSELNEIFGGIFGDIFSDKRGLTMREFDESMGALGAELHLSEQLSADSEVLHDDTERAEEALEKVEGDNVTDFTVSTLQVAQENIRKRWALNTPVVARESYRRGNNRQAARESWKETLKELWARFVELCKHVRDKARDIWYNFTNEGKSIHKRTVRMLNDLDKLDKPKDIASFDVVPTYVRKTLILNSFDPVAVAGMLEKMMGTGFNATMKAFRETTSNAASFIGQRPNKSLFGFDQLFPDSGRPLEIRAAGDYCDELQRSLPKISTAMSSSIMKHYSIAEVTAVTPLPGNAILMAGVSAVGGGVSKDNIRRKVALVRYTALELDDPTDKIPVMGTKELRTIINGVQRAATKYEKFIKDFRIYEAELEKLEKAAEKASNLADRAADDDIDGEGKAELNVAGTIARLQVLNFEHLNRAIIKTVSQASHGLLGYCQACMRMHEPKKA